MPKQFFALDSTHGSFAAAIAALATANAANFSYTPTLVQRSATYDSDIKIIAAVVEEGDLTGDLADLADAAVPNDLCQHRWYSAESFRMSGFQQLGESVRSYWGVAGRTAMFIRPQQGTSRTADNYGAGDGSNWYNALNGPQDPAINGGTNTIWQSGKDYFICGGGPNGDSHCRWGDFGAGGNPDASNGLAGQGELSAVDATGLGEAGRIRVASDPDMPGMFLGTFTLWHQHNNGLAWEEYDPTNHIYVQGGFQGGASGQYIGQTSAVWEADCEDITQDGTTLIQRHCLKGKTSLSDLNGDGGRGRYHAQAAYPSATDWAAVLTFDGTSTYADVTTAANNATAADVTVLAVSAADGAGILFGMSAPFSRILATPSTNGVGTYTGEFVYSKGSGTWGAFNNSVNAVNSFKTSPAGPFPGTALVFNPVSDWATDTIDGVGPYYWVFFRKTGGTVSTAPVVSQLRARKDAVFVHRWNDAAPVRGLCTGEGANSAGYRFNLLESGPKGNFEFFRYRIAGINQHETWCDVSASATDMILSGCQMIIPGDMRYRAGTPAWTFRAASYGTRWWSIDDHLHTDKADAFIQGILERVQAGIDAGINLNDHGVEPDLTAFDDLGDWNDVLGPNNGPYGSGSSNWAFIFDGHKTRRPGDSFDGMNDTAIFTVSGGDNHGLAHYGNHDGTNDSYKRIAIEKGNNSIDFYASATGNNDMPVAGASSAMKNLKFSHGYCSGVGSQVDVHSPKAIAFENDPDVGLYDDGTGGNTGNQVYFWGAKDMRKPDNSGAAFFVAATSNLQKVHYCYIDNPGTGGAYGTNGGFSNAGPRSTNVFRATTADSLTDLTANLKDTGNTASALFPTGVADECLYLGVVRYVQRRFTFDITTAGVGGPTLAWEYYNGSSWAAVSNLSDGTSGFTVDGTVTFDRPAAAPFTRGSKDIYAIRCRIVSGSFSVVPQAVEIGTEIGCGSIDFQFNRIKNVDTASGCCVARLVHSAGVPFLNTGVVIDKNNIIELGAGQSSSTAFWILNGTSSHDQASWEALSKLALTSDALQDSEFGPNTLV